MKLILFWLFWSANHVIVYADVANQGVIFVIIETKLYATVVTLSTQENAKLLTQLKSGFKTTINWNRYLSKPELLAQNLNQLLEPSFQKINRVFVLAFENNTERTSIKRYYLPNVEMKVCNIIIGGKQFFDQPIKIIK